MLALPINFSQVTRGLLLLSIALWLSACSTVLPAPDATRQVKSQSVPLVTPQASVQPVAPVMYANETALQATDRLMVQAENHPRLAGPWISMSVLALHDGDVERARALLTEAIKRNPEDCHAHVQRGLLERQQLNFAAARDHYQACINIDPGFAAAHLNLGILNEIYLGRLPQALKNYQHYQALNPEKRVDMWISLITRQIATQQRLLAENES